jgi:hypothetical protein
MKLYKIWVLVLILSLLIPMGACTAYDPYPEDAYFGDIYTNGVLIVPGGGAAHDILSVTHSDSTIAAVSRGSLITGQGVAPTWSELIVGGAGEYLQTDGTDVLWGALVEADPIYTGDPAFGITALDIAGWNGIVASQWTTDANGITYAGNVGINTPSAVADKLYVYSNAGGATQTALHVTENSASAGAYGIQLSVMGAKTSTTYGEYIYNAASSATNAINKYGLYIRSESNWTGAGAINYDLFLQEATDGTLNFEIGGNSSLRLTTNGDTDDYFTFSTVANIPTIAATGAAYLAIDNATLVNGNLSIGGSSNELRFYEGVNYVGFEAPALAGDQIWVLPAADGGAGEVLSTNGGGILSWIAAGGGMVNPMTTLGDIIYEDGTPAPERLAGDTSNTNKFLRSLSIAGVAQAPSWQSVTKTDVGLSAVENTALSTWAGSANITTLGSISSGSWHGTTIAPEHGGTGVANNAASTLTITGNFTLGLTLTANTLLTLPTSGILATIGNGCVLNLNGQEGTGSTISDISGQNNHGTITGATWVRLPSGVWGNSFDGVNDSINFGDKATLNFPTGNFSFGFWIKRETNWSGYNQIFGKMSGTTGYGIFTVDAALNLYFAARGANDAGSTGFTTFMVPTSSLWSSCWWVISRSGTSFTLTTYRNGNIIGSQTETVDGSLLNAEWFYILRNADKTGITLILKEVGFNRALSAAEISAKYNEEKHLFEQPPIVSGEVRSDSGSLTGGAANAILFAWHNPELTDIYIKKVVITLTTADADAANIDCGIADNATYTNGGTEFFDDLAGETIAVDDSFVAGDGGTQTKWVLCQDSASATDGWVVAKILDADGSSIVGTYYIEYVGK